MTGSAEWAAELLSMPTSAWAAYLSDHSGLPGPRANLELVSAFAPLADEPTIDALLTTGDEYHAMCAAAALGVRAEDAASERRAREHATDGRWRVREGVALGLQLLGDTTPAALASIVDAWVDHAHPLVQRVAEPDAEIDGPTAVILGVFSRAIPLTEAPSFGTVIDDPRGRLRELL